ncbi:SH3 domain-containing protein [Ensifer sp.]|uniref:SH3 domain-containing protein n=1 Tax=Ensifer sp. TaxID=1872086 RepID=UPI00289FFADF|nr:SH3 domain-containing protein [Ensifer sp.]
MRRFLVGGGVAATLIYWLGTNSGERAAVNETRLPPARIVVGSAPQKDKSSATVQSADTEVIATVFVRGKRVALREGPGKKFPILDRYDTGRPVRLLSVDGEWSYVQDDLTRREGWIASHLLSSDTEPKRDKSASGESSRVEPGKVPRISDSVIVQRIIAESISGYSGSCACPESRDRAGRRCGRRSAYSKPGGAAPICYPSDVSRAMIDAFRSRL